MNIKLEVLPPLMPNFIRFKQEAGLKQDGFRLNEAFPISNLTMDEAYEYAELMKQTFIKHWEEKTKSK